MTTGPGVDIPMTRYLGEDGDPVADLPAWAADHQLLVGFYRSMVLTRVFDRKAVALQRTGQMGTYPSCLGQEAIGVAIAHLMSAADVLVPYYRDQSAQLGRGVSMAEILLYWGGDERGSRYRDNAVDLPNAVPIATQCAHAAGVAAAMRIQGRHDAVVCTCGDGATSKGDFLESINVAGAWQLPLVFVVNNNQWAISVPRSIQCGAPTLAQKAVGAGFPGEQVDGNDVIALVEVIGRALERARAGKGATLVEAISYRLGDHTTADDATRYRSPEEVNEAWRLEPVQRLRDYLHGVGAWNELQEKALYRDCEKAVEKAVREYQETPPEPPEAMFDYLYANLPHALEEQREAVIARAARMDGGGP